MIITGTQYEYKDHAYRCVIASWGTRQRAEFNCVSGHYDRNVFIYDHICIMPDGTEKNMDYHQNRVISFQCFQWYVDLECPGRGGMPDGWMGPISEDGLKWLAVTQHIDPDILLGNGNSRF